jgi:NitT/TauT family transport system ATP-binding protein
MMNSRSPIPVEESTMVSKDRQLVPKLEVQAVSKLYTTRGKPLTVLEHISLQIQAREFVCLVGASGCGKSTLLNIIAGLLPPSSGEVRVGDNSHR